MTAQTSDTKPKRYHAKPNTWDKFYFAPEFWLISAVVIGLVCFMRYSSATPAVLHNEVVFQVYGTFSGLVIIAATNYVLERRGRAVAQGSEPLSYRLQSSLEKFGGLKLTLFVANIILLFALLYGHIWTPKGDFQHMYTGLAFAKMDATIWLLPALNLLAISCAVFGRLFTKRLFLGMAALLAAAYVVAFVTFVSLSTNTAKNSPEPDGIAFTLLITAGLVAVVAPIVAAIIGFRKPEINN